MGKEEGGYYPDELNENEESDERLIITPICYEEAMETIYDQIVQLQRTGEKIERDARNGMRQNFYKTPDGQIIYQPINKGRLGFLK